MQWVFAIRAWTDVLDFKHRGAKMFLLKPVSQLLNFAKKIPLYSENMNKMQTEFWQSGIFPRSVIQTRFTSYKNLATRLYFLLLFYPHSKFLTFCETFSLSESQAQNKELLSQFEHGCIKGTLMQIWKSPWMFALI